MNNQTNPSIKCSVDTCVHHSKAHCTLNEIQVGATQNKVCDCKETECASFQMGCNGSNSCGC